MSTEAAMANFPVGELSRFTGISDSEVVDLLASLAVFNKVPSEFVEKLKEYFPVFTARMQAAFDSTTEDKWIKLCDEPRKRLKIFWKGEKRANLTEEERRDQTIRCSQSQTMYYCLYVVLLWRHPQGFSRYSDGITTMAAFRAKYEADEDFEKHSLECGSKPDSWVNAFTYRNVLILAAAIRPTERNKGKFGKVACILAEGRVHPFGGGQSYTADRRGYLYDKEGHFFSTGADVTPKAPGTGKGRGRGKKAAAAGDGSDSDGSDSEPGAETKEEMYASGLAVLEGAASGMLEKSHKRNATWSASRSSSDLEPASVDAQTAEQLVNLAAYLASGAPESPVGRPKVVKRPKPAKDQTGGSSSSSSSLQGNNVSFAADAAEEQSEERSDTGAEAADSGAPLYDSRWEETDPMGPSLATAARVMSNASRMQPGSIPLGAGAMLPHPPMPSGYVVGGALNQQFQRQISGLDGFGGSVRDDYRVAQALSGRDVSFAPQYNTSAAANARSMSTSSDRSDSESGSMRFVSFGFRDCNPYVKDESDDPVA